TLMHRQGAVRDLANALGNRPAMLGLQRDRFQNEKVERSLRQLDSRCGFDHVAPLPLRHDATTRSCRSAREVTTGVLRAGAMSAGNRPGTVAAPGVNPSAAHIVRRAGGASCRARSLRGAGPAVHTLPQHSYW